MNSRSTNRLSQKITNLPLEIIEENPFKKKPKGNSSKTLDQSYEKAKHLINKLIETGEDISQTQGECQPCYDKIKEGMLNLKWIINERQQQPSERVLPRVIEDNLQFDTFQRFPAHSPKKSFASRFTSSKSPKEPVEKDGDVLCATEMFGGTSLVFATDRNLLIGYDLKDGRQYSKQIKDSFVTCLEFYSQEGILIAGHSNNIVNFINPRNHKFKILKTFYDLTAFPPIQIKTIQGLNKLIMINSANEVILCERTKSKTVKYKSRGIIRANPRDMMFEIEVLEFPISKGAVVALISERKVRLVWVMLDQLFQVQFLESFHRLESEGKSQLNKLSNENSFSLENFSITKKSNFSLDFFSDSKRVSEMNKHLSMNISDLIMLLKKRAKPSYGRSSIFLMSKKLWRSTGEKMFTVSIFGKKCEVSFSIIAGNGNVMKILSRRFSFDDNVIYASVLGVEMVLILFENLEFCFLHLDQFRKEEDTGNSEVGVLQRGSLGKSNKSNDEGSGTETMDSEGANTSKDRRQSELETSEMKLTKQVHKALKRYVLGNDKAPIDFENLEFFCQTSKSDNVYIIFRGSIKVVRLKHWFEYIKTLKENSSYISALYWISEIVKGNCVRLSGVETPLVMTPVMEQYIMDIVKMFIEQGLSQENVNFMLEISIEILIKMKKFEFLFNEFLLKLQSGVESAQQTKLVRVFIRYLASFIRQMGLENLPEYFFGLIFTFEEDEVIPQFLFYLCGYFDITSKLSYFFPVLINRQLDEHLMYISLNSSPDNFHMVLEAWLSRIEPVEIPLTQSRPRVRFILSFVYDIMFAKQYRELDEVKRVVRGFSKEENRKKRTSLDLGIIRMLLTWLFTSETFLRFVRICPKETLTFYNMLLMRYHESGADQMFFGLGEMVQKKTQAPQASNAKILDQVSQLRAESEMFQNMHPALNKFFLGLLFSQQFTAHIWMLILSKILGLKVNPSKLSMFMFKLIEPANQIVRKKKQQLEQKQTLSPPDQEITFVNDKNYDQYCILVYDFFKTNSEAIKATNQVQTYIERGEGKE